MGKILEGLKDWGVGALGMPSLPLDAQGGTQGGLELATSFPPTVIPAHYVIPAEAGIQRGRGEPGWEGLKDWARCEL